MEASKKRKRIRTPNRFKAGDVFWANEINGWHLVIILEDHALDNHQSCIPVCNFSGSNPGNHLEYVIPIGDYKLPDCYWTDPSQVKHENWIICQPRDCIKAMKYRTDIVVGNIKNDCPDLYSLLCDKTKKCKIAPRLKSLCNCEEISIPIEISNDDCECLNGPRMAIRI